MQGRWGARRTKTPVMGTGKFASTLLQSRSVLQSPWQTPSLESLLADDRPVKCDGKRGAEGSTFLLWQGPVAAATETPTLGVSKKHCAAIHVLCRLRAGCGCTRLRREWRATRAPGTMLPPVRHGHVQGAGNCTCLDRSRNLRFVLSQHTLTGSLAGKVGPFRHAESI